MDNAFMKNKFQEFYYQLYLYKHYGISFWFTSILDNRLNE